MEDSPDFFKIRIPDPVLFLGLKVRTFPDPNFCDKLMTIAILKSVPKKIWTLFFASYLNIHSSWSNFTETKVKTICFKD